MEDADYYLASFKRTVTQLEKLLRLSNDSRDIIAALPHNPDSFYWSDAQKSRRNSTTRDALFEGPETEYALDTYEYFGGAFCTSRIGCGQPGQQQRHQAQPSKAAIIWLMRDIRDFEMVCLPLGKTQTGF